MRKVKSLHDKEGIEEIETRWKHCDKKDNRECANKDKIYEFEAYYQSLLC